MIKEDYCVVGVMSGTSLDGIDLAYLHFKKEENWNYEIIHGETISYTSEWENKLRVAVGFSDEELQELNMAYTKLLAEVISRFISKNKLKGIDAVCSHGHTILHQPQKGITLQIGNLKELATLIQQTVVCDFRVQDVQLGGQGAPLVPIGDKLLFSEYDYCLNLGGFSNISMEENDRRIAYDVCPVNIVLNHYVQQLGVPYDDKGGIAKSGATHKKLLQQLNELPFYQLPAPKSLGLEWVKAIVIPIIDAFDLEIKDVLHTFVTHIAIQLANEIKIKEAKVLITGGGTYNLFLIDTLKSLIKAEINPPHENLIEYKEALIFGFLGVLKMRNETNVLASVTGASKDHSSGEIFHYKKSY